MKLVACIPVRNEDWVLGLSARVALLWCDEIVLWLHACTDNSHAIATQIQIEHPGRVLIREEPGEQWDEMDHRQKMLEAARQLGATQIAIVDADEVLTGNLIPKVGGAYNEPRQRSAGALVEWMRPEMMMQLPGYNLRNGLNSYHANGLWGNRWFSVAFADNPALHWGGDRFHHREPMGLKLWPYQPIDQGAGGVMHLWGASERRLRAKHAFYQVTERLRWPLKPTPQIARMYSMWRSDIDCQPEYLGPRWKYAPVPAEWWAPYAHLMKYLDVDAEPWQEAECRRLVAKHGAEFFRGLDLFGIA